MDEAVSEEYGRWYRYNRHRLVKFAHKLGLKPAEDFVNDAVRRTLEPTSAFPHADTTLWWSWHCSALRSIAYNLRHLGAKRKPRATEARKFAAIQSRVVPWTQVSACKKTKRQERRVWARWGKGEVFIDRVQRSIHNRHGYLYPPQALEPPPKCRCGMALTRRIEREGKTAVYVYGCVNGHRQYGEVQS